MKRNYALDAMVMALKEEIMVTTKALSTRIQNLDRELTLHGVAVGNRVLSATLNCEDVPKQKEFARTRSACDMDNFLWRIEHYFRAKGIMEDVSKGKTSLSLPSLRVYEGNHEEDNDSGNGNPGRNGKPQVRKKKSNKKRGKLRCFLCDSLHLLKKCPKKFMLSKKDKLKGKAVRLHSNVRGVKAKKAKRDDVSDKEPKKFGLSNRTFEANGAKRSKKKRVKCFLYYGSRELRNCPKQIMVKEKATSELLESSKGLPLKEVVILPSDLGEKVEMKTVKLRPMRLNSSKATKLSSRRRGFH
ncbi:hypothetical protein PVK06_001291 [Gossypium arboreum]|uniref:Uncharacterized protein n=1 Tax=Gossypium arboreum TaxID=29729 RepID=A0ABR0R1Y3_GOSAR|nr:hypothetical protein PVK06_001291 [Gossypium arboreum]